MTNQKKRELLLFRHGKSDWTADCDDFHRPLTKRGILNTLRCGAWLLLHGIYPDYIISSPATRTRTTAELLCHVMELSIKTIKYDERIYEAQVDELISVLRDCPNAMQRILLVGHNPGLEDLLLQVKSGRSLISKYTKILPTSALGKLAVDSSWDKFNFNQTHLVSINRPDTFPETFPYPSPNGKDYRKKPAYFYQQSAVIPYRIHKEKLEIMIVSSSKGKHWVLPKGIIEPDLSASESAVKEALEEAGVEGKVDETSLGSYVYEKWGAKCHVQVFPFKVNNIISSKTWEENHRKRQWVTPEKAIKLLNLSAIEPVILNFAAKIHSH